MAQRTYTNKSADSKLLAKPVPILCPDYSPKETMYLQRLQADLETARNARDCNHDEFDGMTFVESWQAEEKAANTYILPKINEGDNNFQSGIQRDSILSVVAQVANMDLNSDIHAYDENQFEVTGLGKAIETIIEKYKYLDNDSEKKIERAYELLKHGYYFVETLWEERWGWAKKWVSKFDGTIGTAKWTKKLRLLYARPVRNILSGLLVYLGDITQKDFSKQQLVFTVKYRDYDDWASEYMRTDKDGKPVWERAQYVTKQRQDVASYLGPQIVYNTWRLTEVTQTQVEEIHCQYKFSNEFAILCNGVLMTPIGMPLPWGYDDFNIEQQNLEPIHPFFAYGKSLISRMRVNTAIYDELLKVGVLKTQKSLFPARLNMTGKTITRKMFMPSQITNATFTPAQIPTIDEKDTQGVTGSEFEMIESISKNITSKTMMPQQGTGKMTNQEIAQQQQAAQVAAGWFMFFIALGEQKLDWKLLFTILTHHFDPTDKKMDDVKGKIKKTYQITNQPAMIPGKGMGNRIIVPTEEPVSAQNITDYQDELQKKTGTPHEIIVLNPVELQKSKWIWQIVCTPQQKKTSDTAKVLFRGFMEDLDFFGDDVNKSYVEEEYAATWGKDPAKLFKPQGQQQPALQGGQPTPGGQPNQLTPQPKKPIAGMPTPAKGMAASISNTIKPQS